MRCDRDKMVKIPIVFCFDSRIILGAAVTIKSLIEHAEETTCYDIRIFHSEISEKDQKSLQSLLDGTSHEMKFHYINPDLFKSRKSLGKKALESNAIRDSNPSCAAEMS